MRAMKPICTTASVPAGMAIERSQPVKLVSMLMNPPLGSQPNCTANRKMSVETEPEFRHRQAEQRRRHHHLVGPADYGSSPRRSPP